MPRPAFILVLLAAISGCTTPDIQEAGHTHQEEEASATLEYFIENYPTKEQMLAVRGCTTLATGFIFPDLPKEYGPHNLTSPSPILVAQALDNDITSGVDTAFMECVFELGFEDNFYLPEDQDAIRNAPYN